MNLLISLSHIAGSPFVINVAEELDLATVRVEELTASQSSEGMYVIGEAAELLVDATSCTGFDLPAFSTRVSAVTSGTKSAATVAQLSDYSYRVRFQPREPDTYLLGIYFGTEPVPGSPFRLAYGTAPAPQKCQVLGLKPEGWHVAQPVVFHVATGDAGVGNLEVEMVTPNVNTGSSTSLSSLTTSAIIQREGALHTVELCPLHPGYHHVHVTWAGHHVPGSPFQIAVLGNRPDASRCRLTGPDLRRQYFKVRDVEAVCECFVSCVCVCHHEKKCQMNGTHDKRYLRYFK